MSKIITLEALLKNYNLAKQNGEAKNTQKISKRAVRKGDLIKFDLGSKLIDPNSQFANEYRVLEVDGNSVYVVSMYDLANMQFGDTQDYFTSNIDHYLEWDFYNSLSEKMRKLIIPQLFYQEYFKRDKDGYDEKIYSSYANKIMEECSNGIRHIALLDYQDILNYFGGKFSKQDIFKTFFKKEENGGGRTFWLRSAYASSSDSCWCVGGDDGFVNNDNYYDSSAARPAFKIDISNLDFEFIDEK